MIVPRRPPGGFPTKSWYGYTHYHIVHNAYSYVVNQDTILYERMFDLLVILEII